MKKCILFIVVFSMLLSASAFAERIHITPNNFSNYFAVSVEVTNYQTKRLPNYGTLLTESNHSCDLTLRVDAKYPCDIYNVTFSITAEGGLSTGSYTIIDNCRDDKVFRGNIPQGGSFFSSQQANVRQYDMLPTYGMSYHAKVTSADGYIEIK